MLHHRSANTQTHTHTHPPTEQTKTTWTGCTTTHLSQGGVPAASSSRTAQWRALSRGGGYRPQTSALRGSAELQVSGVCPRTQGRLLLRGSETQRHPPALRNTKILNNSFDSGFCPKRLTTGVLNHEDKTQKMQKSCTGMQVLLYCHLKSSY